MIRQFSFMGAKKIVFGRGSFDALAEHIRELKGIRPMVVLDKNLAEAGFRDKISDLLIKRNLNLPFLIRLRQNHRWSWPMKGPALP